MLLDLMLMLRVSLPLNQVCLLVCLCAGSWECYLRASFRSGRLVSRCAPLFTFTIFAQAASILFSMQQFPASLATLFTWKSWNYGPLADLMDLLVFLNVANWKITEVKRVNHRTQWAVASIARG